MFKLFNRKSTTATYGIVCICNSLCFAHDIAGTYKTREEAQAVVDKMNAEKQDNDFEYMVSIFF